MYGFLGTRIVFSQQLQGRSEPYGTFSSTGGASATGVAADISVGAETGTSAGTSIASFFTGTSYPLIFTRGPAAESSRWFFEASGAEMAPPSLLNKLE